MSYTPYLVANFATSLDIRLQPWLRVDDAVEEFYDGYVYRGVMSKRPGYKGFAIGGVGGAPYTDSRVVGMSTMDAARTSGGALVVGDGTTLSFSIVTPNGAIRRGSISITDGSQVITDNGLGLLFQGANPAGTVNYTTGVITAIFQTAPTNGLQIYITYSYEVDEPVMGVMNFTDMANTKFLIIGTTKRLNIYNSGTNTLNYLGADLTISGVTTDDTTVTVTTTTAVNWLVGDTVYIYGLLATPELNNMQWVISGVSGSTFMFLYTGALATYTSGGFVQRNYTGTNFSFWSWINYKDGANNPRLIFTNNQDQVQYYAPSDGDAVVGDYINYPTAASPQFMMLADDGSTPITTLLALQVIEYKDRMELQRTTENGAVKPQRLRISGTGVNSDNFLTSATGAGFIDIPDSAWINGSTPSRDNLITFTEYGTWAQQYTGNDTAPIVLTRIDDSRGSGAAFSAITYLNRISAASPRGLIISDGYRVERADERIPDFSFDDIYAENFELCFVGVVDEDRDHYLIYPTTDSGESDQILVTNYDEDNYTIYRLSLSCMGTYQTVYNVTWADLLRFDNWNQFAAEYSNWHNFSFSQASPISIGGGHHGEVWQLNVNEAEDNPQMIRAITNPSPGILQIVTDWNNYSLNDDNPTGMNADYIYFSGIEGMVELNNQQYAITSVIDNYTFQIKVSTSLTFSTYTPNTGTAIRVIPFTCTFKQFNPFLNMDKKVRCGWIYFYVSTTNSDLTTNYALAAATKANPCVITTVLQNNFKNGQTATFFGVGGMTQLNAISAPITVISPTSFSLTGIDSTAFGAYTSGGYVVAPVNASLQVQIITNDNNKNIVITNPDVYPLQPNCTNLLFADTSKKWYKLFVNQVGKFIQMKITNIQAGANISLHATVYGFQGVGRII